MLSTLRLVHSDSTSTHINTLHTLRTHAHCENALSCLAMRKVKTETEIKKVECLLLCLHKRAVLEQAVHEQLLWLFDKFSKVCKKGTKCARTVSLSTRAWYLTGVSSAKLHFAMGDTKMFLFFPNVSTINAFVSGIVFYGNRSWPLHGSKWCFSGFFMLAVCDS